MENERTEAQVKANTYSNIDERVKVYLQGKHGRIGLIYPDEPISQDEWETLNREMAMILYKRL